MPSNKQQEPDASAFRLITSKQRSFKLGDVQVDELTELMRQRIAGKACSMEYSDEELSYDSNLFASEVHYCLFNGGVRSSGMRRLWRLAKGNPELEQVLEIKVAEFRRVAREDRIPTVWNLPVRTGEWISDRVKFTPPREVATTLAYVVFAVFAVDAVKSRLPWRLMASSLFSGSSTTGADRSSDYDLFALPETKPRFSFTRSNLAARSDSGATTSELSESPTDTLDVGSSVSAESMDHEIDSLIKERIQKVLDSADMKELLQKSGSASGVDSAKLNELVAQEVEARLKALNIVSPDSSAPTQSSTPVSDQNQQTSIEGLAAQTESAILASVPVASTPNGNDPETKGTP